MGRTFKQMQAEQRWKLKAMLEDGRSIADIAKSLGFHRSAIYREIERGSQGGCYDPQYAQMRCEEKQREKGREEKLADRELAGFISDLIRTEHLSPEKIIEVLQKSGNQFSDIPQSPKTIYTAIDKGLIPGVSREDLLQRTSRVYSGGQICIPRWALERLDIKDGDVLELEITDDGSLIYRKKEQ